MLLACVAAVNPFPGNSALSRESVKKKKKEKKIKFRAHCAEHSKLNKLVKRSAKVFHEFITKCTEIFSTKNIAIFEKLTSENLTEW